MNIKFTLTLISTRKTFLYLIKKFLGNFLAILVQKEIRANGSTVQISIINDYGSEDLSATLHRDKNGQYILKQGEGSTIKIVVDRKWVKIPKTLVLHKK